MFEIKKQIPLLLKQINVLEERPPSQSDDQSKKIKQLNEIVHNATSIISTKTQELAQFNMLFNQVEKRSENSKNLLSQMEKNCQDTVREICTTNDHYDFISGISRQILLIKNIFDVFVDVLEPLGRVKIIKKIGERNQELESISTQLNKLSKKMSQQNNVTISNFQINDSVLFQKKGKDLWECFNIGSPCYYLDYESVHAINLKYEKNVPEQVVGNIVIIQKLNCQEEKSNPLKFNYPYYFVTISF